MGPLSLAAARQMFKAFYGHDGIERYSPRTGAELQQMFSTLPAAAAEAELASGAAAPSVTATAAATAAAPPPRPPDRRRK